MTEAMTVPTEHAVELHDHAWRRVGSEADAGILHYRCDLCSITWSGPRPARPRDPRETGLRRG
jgi:hypothetical protein